MRNTILVLTVAGAVLLSSGCRQLQSRNQLNQGVEAFKIAQYPEAAEHFKRAVDLQPDFLEARLYLGTAYMLQYEYGAAMEGPESERTAQAAHDEFTKVLSRRPRKRSLSRPSPRFTSSSSSGATPRSGMRSWSPSIPITPRVTTALVSSRGRAGFPGWGKPARISACGRKTLVRSRTGMSGKH